MSEDGGIGSSAEERSVGVHSISVIVQEILQVIIVPASLSPRNLDSLLLLLLLGHGAENVLELSL